MIDKFYKYLKDIKNYSISTCENYHRTIIRFDNFLRTLTLWQRWAEECVFMFNIIAK